MTARTAGLAWVQVCTFHPILQEWGCYRRIDFAIKMRAQTALKSGEPCPDKNMVCLALGTYLPLRDTEIESFD